MKTILRVLARTLTAMFAGPIAAYAVTALWLAAVDGLVPWQPRAFTGFYCLASIATVALGFLGSVVGMIIGCSGNRSRAPVLAAMVGGVPGAMLMAAFEINSTAPATGLGMINGLIFFVWPVASSAALAAWIQAGEARFR